MNDNNNTPKGWGKSNSGNGKSSPWENKSKSSAWGNSPSDPARKITSTNLENSPQKQKSASSDNVNAAFNKFANMAKQAEEKAASGAGSMLSGIKNKAADKISEHRNKSADPDDNSSEQSIEDTYESEAYIDEVSGYEENLESSANAPVEKYEAYSDTTETIEEVNTPKNTSPSFPNKSNNIVILLVNRTLRR